MTLVERLEKATVGGRETRFVHFSDKPLTAVRNVKQKKGGGYKPAGLWFSVEGREDGWRAWCEAETFGLKRLVCETEITLAPSANIVTLRGPHDLDAFTGKFSLPPAWARGLTKDHHVIDWREVAKHHDGIIIAPYCYERRFELSWYYGWDCASGAIWNANAIAALRARESK